MYRIDAFPDLFLDALKYERSSIFLIGFCLRVDPLTPLWTSEIPLVPPQRLPLWYNIHKISCMSTGEQDDLLSYVMISTGYQSHPRSWSWSWNGENRSLMIDTLSDLTKQSGKVSTKLVLNPWSTTPSYSPLAPGLPEDDLYSFILLYVRSIPIQILALNPCQSSWGIWLCPGLLTTQKKFLQATKIQDTCVHFQGEII